MADFQPESVGLTIEATLREALAIAPQVALDEISAEYLEAHWLNVLEAVWLIEAACGVDLPLNDNLPAQHIQNAEDLKNLCLAVAAPAA